MSGQSGQLGVDVAFWNIYGRAIADVTLEDVHDQLKRYKVICLSETRLTSAAPLLDLFPEYSVFIHPAAKNTKGYGLATLVHCSVARTARHVTIRELAATLCQDRRGA
jgi:hypothetical protein